MDKFFTSKKIEKQAEAEEEKRAQEQLRRQQAQAAKAILWDEYSTLSQEYVQQEKERKIEWFASIPPDIREGVLDALRADEINAAINTLRYETGRTSNRMRSLEIQLYGQILTPDPVMVDYKDLNKIHNDTSCHEILIEGKDDEPRED